MTLLLPDGSPWGGTPRDGMAKAEAKAATGAGVGFYNAGHPPLMSMERTPQAMMRRAQLAYHVNPWVGTAESVVTRKVVGTPWHLEDGDEGEYGDERDESGVAENEDVKSARQLIERPQLLVGNLHPGTATRRLMWALTSRHLGLCGMTHWYGDRMDLSGAPQAWLYVNPARMWAESDAQDNLSGWMLDATGVDGRGQPYGGLHFELREILTFYLDPPDHGHYGSGLYERAMLKAQVSSLADQHVGYVLGTGGRIAGIVSPKEGSIPDEKFKTLVAEFRNVNEAPDAAKRTTIMQGPTDFTPTAANPAELDLIEMSKMNRDDVFTIWGVPNSQAGVETPAGLNSGATKGFDEAILMQGPVHDRIVSMRETMQFDWLDKYPTTIELVFEEPEFDDDTPAYERLSKATSAPLTNAQRLEIIGLPPTGDPAIDNAILLPSMVTVWATAPGDGEKQGVITPEPEPEPTVAPIVVEPVEEEKASARKEFLGLRRSLDQRTVPAVKDSVAKSLSMQRKRVVSWLRGHADHLEKNPANGGWWNEAKEDEWLTTALRPHMAGVAKTVTKQARGIFESPVKAMSSYTGFPAAKADFEDRVESELLRNIGLRIAGINKHTRDTIAAAIRQGFDDGLSVAEVADLIETSTLFSELRAETIARTETMFAYNAAALDSYSEFGVERVEAIDGDEDLECASRDGRDYSIAEAQAIEDHPNGTLDWAPYFGEAKAGSGMAPPLPEPLPVTPVPAAAPPFDIAAMVREIALAMRPERLGPLANRVQFERDDYGKIVAITTPEGDYHERMLKAVLDRPEPKVEVNLPEINVPAPVLNIAEGAVQVTMPQPLPKRIERDEKGQVTRIVDDGS